MKQELSKATQGIRQTTLRLGFCTVQFGFHTEKLNDVGTGKSVTMKVSGREPVNAGGTFRVFTIGLMAVKYGERIRVGFIKRRETLQKL